MHRSIPLLALLLSPVALAQEVEEPETQKVKYKDRTELDFDGLELSASADRPGMALVVAPPQGTFNPLIKLRTSFSAEMKQSVDEVK